MASTQAIPETVDEFVAEKKLNGTSTALNYANGTANGNGKAKDQDMYPPGDSTRSLSQKKRARKDDSLLSILCAFIVEHQIGLSVNLLLLLALTHIFFPRARRRTRKFFEMSYYDPSTGLYTQGVDDFYVVALWVVIFTGLRCAIMDYVLKPFAEWGGLKSKKTLVRFAEQGWLIVYCSFFWSLGMYLAYNSKYWFNLRELWTDFPTKTMGGLLKWYYLVQSAFWLQQIVVVNIEERRKDYAQMFTHHIFTCALIFSSYGFYQTKVGNAILCIMDVVDIILPTAKLLKYLKFQKACDAAFVLFLITWFVTRHIFYPLVCYSIHAHVPSIMATGCYNPSTGEMVSSDGGKQIWANVMQPFINPNGTVCFNENIRYGFLGLLLALQGLLLIWFSMVCRVAYGVIMGTGADDSRSDDECDEEEPLDDEEEARNPSLGLHAEHVNPAYKQPLEEEVGVEALHFNRRTSSQKRQYKKSGGRASGISIPGHSDRKELLGRIGCDKPPDSD
ncbi:longevity-assurance protein-like protein [Aulographum hederae CBS 113979]|uniref:Longevity-assurance protein-like protein n=1 Tax=Aulographum hederae CBS 113979 TaxID=1176131 RepID=A0A6G1H757_9PEZI|nr:longevity-assurance protein-like protein [Aulographum hederae CBS 113979]